MPNAKEVKSIVVHCSAGFGDVNSIRNFWNSIGWINVGYHRIIDVNGVTTDLASFKDVTNGVRGFNSSTIHICYIGGVERMPNKTFKAKDTRTDKQKVSLIFNIEIALRWLYENGCDMSKLEIKGHRDFSPDRNGNGVVDSWERIKECPSFDAIQEYKNLLSPYLSTVYVVKKGDTLWNIANSHKVTVDHLMRVNKLYNNVLSVGQKLKIK